MWITIKQMKFLQTFGQWSTHALMDISVVVIEEYIFVVLRRKVDLRLNKLQSRLSD